MNEFYRFVCRSLLLGSSYCEKQMNDYVQELLNIGTQCRIYEIKHACYGVTAGLINSLDRLSQNFRSTKKAMVIMTDIARYGFDVPGEATQGAGAVALLVEKDPKFATVDTSLNGIFSKNAGSPLLFAPYLSCHCAFIRFVLSSSYSSPSTKLTTTRGMASFFSKLKTYSPISFNVLKSLAIVCKGERQKWGESGLTSPRQ